MVLNDSFLTGYASPASLKKSTNDSFNDSFGDKSTLTPSIIFRGLQKEHDQICSVLRFQPPTVSQYQNSLIELISLFERAEDHASIGFQKLTISVFLKLAANVLNALEKPKYQPTLYKLSQIIANSIEISEEDSEVDQENLRKWADRIIIESSIHLQAFQNFQLDMEFSIENIIDDLGLSNGRFQFVKSSVFESARYMSSECRRDIQIFPQSKFSLKNVGDEHFLRLLLWFLIKDESKTILNGEFLPSLFSTLPQTPRASEIVQSPCSLLDVKIFLTSLSVIASTTTESGTTAKRSPVVASQLSLTKYQKDCWKAVVDISDGSQPSALCRLRTSQLVDSVRLTSDGSEDVRVLFEAWKHCLQPSAAHDENVFEAVEEIKELYRVKINQLLCFGPFYSADPSTFQKASLGGKREVKTLFPLQFDYEFVDTKEADHIGVVINSLEGFSTRIETEGTDDELPIPDDLDDTFHSCVTPQFSPDNSQFYSPLMHNRHSICPNSAQKIQTSSFPTTVTPTHPSTVTPSPKNSPIVSGSTPQGKDLSIERLQNANFSITKDSSDESEEDELEAALLESTQKHESMLLSKSSPDAKTPVTPKSPRTPMKDAQTDTDDVSSESSIVSVKYTPKREVLKKKEDVRVLEEEEEEEVEDDDLLDDEAFEAMMEQILVATTDLFVNRRLDQFGIMQEKIPTENTTDEEIMRKAQLKLAKISNDLSANFKRLEKLAVPCEILPKIVLDTHPSAQCFSCQSDDIQESALRCLEKMALDWDAEGNDYLYAK